MCTTYNTPTFPKVVRVHVLPLFLCTHVGHMWTFWVVLKKDFKDSCDGPFGPDWVQPSEDWCWDFG